MLSNLRADYYKKTEVDAKLSELKNQINKNSGAQIDFVYSSNRSNCIYFTKAVPFDNGDNRNGYASVFCQRW